MKKYEIVVSDEENEPDNSLNLKANVLQSFRKKPNASAPPEIVAPTTNTQLNNGSSQTISITSQNEEPDIWAKIKQDNNSLTKSSIPKTDQEIRHWIDTSRPPCTYNLREEETSVNNENRTGKIQSVMSSSSNIKNVNSKCKPSHENTFTSNSSFERYKSDSLQFSSPTAVHLPDIEKHASINNTHFIDENAHLSDVNFPFDNRPSSELIYDQYNQQNSVLQPDLNNHTKNAFDPDYCDTKDTMNDYDSSSSVLTANYIKYVKDNAKLNRKSRSFNFGNRNSDEPNNIKPKLMRGNTISYKMKSADKFLSNASESKRFSPIKSKNNSVVLSDDKKLKGKLDVSKKPYFKHSLEEMKRLNEKVLDTSKASLSSIENSLAEDRQTRNTSQRMFSEDHTLFPLSKVENKPFYSDYGSCTTTSTQVNVLKVCSDRNISMSYTKVETHRYTADVNDSNTIFRNYSKQSVGNYLSDDL